MMERECRTTGNCCGWHVFQSSGGKPTNERALDKCSCVLGRGPFSRFGEQEEEKEKNEGEEDGEHAHSNCKFL